MRILVLACVLYYCQAAIILTPRNPDDVGAAVTFNNQDGLGRYDFGYSEGHPSGASFRRESGDALGNKVGSFGLRDADGRLRVVRYVADANGFRADVTSNEPGVAPSDPASATINKPAVVPAPVVPVAPVVVRPPPPPPPAFVYPPPKPLPPPPPAYNLIYPNPAPLPPPPPPPPRYFGPPPPPPPPRYYGPPPPVAIPAPPPVAVAPVVKAPVGFAAFAPAPVLPPPPPPAYYGNLVQGKGYVSAVQSYPSFIPPFAAVPAQFGYFGGKPSFQALGYPL